MTVDLLTPRDAGHLLGLTTAGVVRLARLGRLAELRDSGGRRLFRREDVEQLVADRQRARSVDRACHVPTHAVAGA